MLSEGWDAKTVTHIMGLRASLRSSLRAGRRPRSFVALSYEVDPKTGLFAAEYVNIFGVPFTFMPHEGGEDDLPPPPPQPTARIQPLSSAKSWKSRGRILFRIDHEYRPELSLDLSKSKPLTLDAYDTPTIADLAPSLMASRTSPTHQH